MIRGWNRVVAWFFGVPVDYASNGSTSRPDWIAHSRLAALVFFVVLPLSGSSWYHLAGLLFPRSRAVQVGSALVMVAAVCMIDSILCRADGRKLGSFSGYASLGLRLFFALCAATSLATGAVLLMLEDQIPQRRDEQVQQRSAAFREKIEKEYDLAGRQAVSDLATKRYDAALAAGREPSAMLKDLQLSDQASACGEHQRKQADLRALAIQRRSLARSGPAAAFDVAQLDARLARATADLRRDEQRCQSWQAELQRQMEREQEGDQVILQESHEAARRAEEALRTAREAVAAQTEEFTRRASGGGGSVLGANLKAAGAIIGEERWARIAAGLVFVLVLLIELAPVIGKLGLLKTSLGRQAAAENAEAERRLDRRIEESERRAGLPEAGDAVQAERASTIPGTPDGDAPGAPRQDASRLMAVLRRRVHQEVRERVERSPSTRPAGTTRKAPDEAHAAAGNARFEALEARVNAVLENELVKGDGEVSAIVSAETLLRKDRT